MRFSFFPVCLFALLLASCDRKGFLKPAVGDREPVRSLAEARSGFQTKLLRRERIGEIAPMPPMEVFDIIKYPSTVGKLTAYVSRSPGDGKKHPAIVWLFGGFSNSISEIAWNPGPKENDQSASGFREAGILMMYPSLRGGNDNPGYREGFYGEVDDVIAAAKYLSTLEYVDPKRIYLGGHSTGGTLAILVAESTNLFRGVFAFGPVESVAGYPSEVLPFDISNRREIEFRAPILWMQSIRTPTFVFEGTTGRSNITSLRSLTKAPHSSVVKFYPVKGADHFSLLAPLTRLISDKIKNDSADASTITFTVNELTAAVR